MIFTNDEVNIQTEYENDLDATQEAISSGRVLYCQWTEPKKGGCWFELMRFARVVNGVVKLKNPPKLRILMTYDKGSQ